MTGWLSTENGKIYKSENGGLNWSSQSFGFYLSTIHFYNDLTGWAAGASILKTTDSGISWFIQSNPSTDYFRSVHFVNDQTGFAAGNLGTIVKTTNSGINWVLISNKITSNNFGEIFFINNQTGWAAGGYGNLFKSTNGGNNWFNQYNNSSIYFTSVRFIDNNTGWTAGTHVLKTSNSGINWTIIASNYLMLKIYPVDHFKLWGLNINFDIVKSVNGGENWVIVNSGYSGQYYDIFFINELTGWAVGTGQKIIKTTDGGATWALQYGNNWPGFFKSIHFYNSNVGFAAGLNPGNMNMLLNTTNGGLNWNVLMFSPLNFNRVFTINNNSAFFTTNEEIYFSSNAGLNWNLQNNCGTNTINSIYFSDSLTGWIAGSNGMIQKTISGGNFVEITIINNFIPENFNLHQNYPNPFNPVTKIKFDIPQNHLPLQGGDREGVLLKIYDLLGREISTLVNEQLKPGSYSVDWDASGYASGVYFYSLVTDQYTETKRMVLLK